MLLRRKEHGVCDGSVERQALLSLLLVKCVSVGWGFCLRCGLVIVVFKCWSHIPSLKCTGIQ